MVGWSSFSWKGQASFENLTERIGSIRSRGVLSLYNVSGAQLALGQSGEQLVYLSVAANGSVGHQLTDEASPIEQGGELSVTGCTGGSSGDTRLSVLDSLSALLLPILVSICYLDGNHAEAETWRDSMNLCNPNRSLASAEYTRSWNSCLVLSPRLYLLWRGGHPSARTPLHPLPRWAGGTQGSDSTGCWLSTWSRDTVR